MDSLLDEQSKAGTFTRSDVIAQENRPHGSSNLTPEIERVFPIRIDVTVTRSKPVSSSQNQSLSYTTPYANDLS